MKALYKAFTAFLLCLGLALPALAQTSEPRLALVLGNAEYAGGAVPTAVNDAGLVAESLRQAGFDVTGAANLDRESLRVAMQEFAAKVDESGRNGVVFVYLAGRAVQYAGENYFLPVDAQIARDTDIAIQGARVSDLTRALGGIPLKARIFVLDAARATPMIGAKDIAGGLELMDADRGFLIAYNAAPGTIAPEEPAPYGAYARALVEMMHEGGAQADDVFTRTRLRVNEVSKGAFIPWHSSALDTRVVFFEAEQGATPAVSLEQTANIRRRPIRDFSADEAYSVAIERDNVDAYQDYLNAYPNAAQAARIRAMLAARREALTWRRTVIADTPNAYWTYLRRYPRGPHAYDARRRLAILRAELEPPAQFEVYGFGGLPPPPPEEIVIFERSPVVVFEPRYGYLPPPPPPAYFVPPRRDVFYDLAPPPPPPSYGYLPLVAAPLVAAPLIMRGLRPVRPQGVYVQPNFGQVRGPQGVRLPGQGGLQVTPGGQFSPLAPQPRRFDQRPGPDTNRLIPAERPAPQPLPGTQQGLVPGARPGGALPPGGLRPGVQPLPGQQPAPFGQRPGVQQPLPGQAPGTQGLAPQGRPGAPAVGQPGALSPREQLMQQRRQELQLKQQRLQDMKAQQLQRQQEMKAQQQQRLQDMKAKQQEMQQQRQQQTQQRLQQMQQQRQKQMEQRQQLQQQRGQQLQQMQQQRQQQMEQRQQLQQQRGQQLQQMQQQRQQQMEQRQQLQQQRGQQLQQMQQQRPQQMQQRPQQMQQMQQQQRPGGGNRNCAFPPCR